MTVTERGLDRFRDADLARDLIREIGRAVGTRSISLMEVCGTHTMAIARYGLRSVLPEGLRLLSGPGCPVCVTANRYVDHAVALSRLDGVTLVTFGDMMRVPGSTSSLSAERAAGRDVRVAYSPLDAVRLARQLPERQVVFCGVGFETTTPTVAAMVLEAAEGHVGNLTVLCAHKRTPPALSSIVADPATRVDGFILPGHVSTVIGLAPYGFLARDHHTPGVVAGFEPVDVLGGIAALVRQVVAGEARIENAYRRCVRPGGNPEARALVDEVFETTDAEWRGLGTLPASGLALRGAYAGFDAARRFDVEVEPTREPRGCRCGDVLRGAVAPDCCPLFDGACTPEHPVGPCMVSSEGSCAAYFRYRDRPADKRETRS